MTTFREYRDEINRIFKYYSRGGFVDYYYCGRLYSDMAKLMEDATEELSSRGEYKELFDLTNKAFLKWGNTDKDDSDGYTQDFVYYVQQAWDKVYEAEDPAIPHAKMYKWFQDHINGSVIDYMEEYLYEYLIHHFQKPELLQKKYAFLERRIAEEQQKKDDRRYNYQLNACQEYLLLVMADMQKPIEEIREYAKKAKVYSYRETLAEIEKRYGNMDAVISLYHELAEEEDQRGWARENWHIKLKDIYNEQGNEEKYREELLFAMLLNVGNADLWKEFKGGYTAEEWPEACGKMFSLARDGDWRFFPWYALENRYDLIMDGIEKRQSTDYLKQYEKELKKRYPDRCLKVLSEDTRRLAEEAKNRRDYKKVARNLRWMQRFPAGLEMAEELVAEFRIAYERRPAMMDEIAEF